MPQKWMKVATQKHHAEHLERVKNMKCSVDCTAPREKIEKNRTVEKVSVYKTVRYEGPCVIVVYQYVYYR